MLFTWNVGMIEEWNDGLLAPGLESLWLGENSGIMGIKTGEM
jgi:hypothetical protein